MLRVRMLLGDPAERGFPGSTSYGPAAEPSPGLKQDCVPQKRAASGGTSVESPTVGPKL